MTLKIYEHRVFSKAITTATFSKVKDADWNDHLGLLVLLEKEEELNILINEKAFITTYIASSTEYPIIRWIDEERILLAEPRIETAEENVFVLNREGEMLSSFHAGDGIAHIESTDEGIWISYFDEGVFGQGISREGLVLFDYGGTPLFKYHSDLSERPFLVSCDAINMSRGSSLWIFSNMMPDVAPALLEFDLNLKKMNSYISPEVLIDSTALCVRDEEAYFFYQFDDKNKVYYWEVGSDSCQLAGEVEGLLRGLRATEFSHFISVEEEAVKLIHIL